MAEPPPVLAVFGAAGQLGRALVEAGPPPGWRLAGFDRAAADITDRAAVKRALAGIGAGAVINAAAFTAVDRAEAEPDAAFAVNRDGAAIIAEAAATAGLALIHVSTDYVFDGTKTSPYGEDDATNPLSVYGASKLAGEQAVRAAGPRHLILRTAWVFSPFGGNFVRTMVRLAAERDLVRVVNDQLGGPTSAEALALAVVAVAPRLLGAPSGDSAFGTFHCCGDPPLTWHDFAAAIFERLGRAGVKVPALAAITSAEYPVAARRPAYSVLSGEKLAAVHGVTPPAWGPGLDRCLSRLLKEKA